MTTQVTRDEAVALNKALGFPSADKWTNEKLTTQTGLAHEIIDGNFEVDNVYAQDALAKVLSAASIDDDIEVVDELDPVEPDEIDTDIDIEDDEAEELGEDELNEVLGTVEDDDLEPGEEIEVEPEPEDDLEPGEEIEVEPEPEDDLPDNKELDGGAGRRAGESCRTDLEDRLDEVLGGADTESVGTFTATAQGIQTDKQKPKTKKKRKSKAKKDTAPTIAYLAGQVIDDRGYQNGVTTEMIHELNELIGEPVGACERQRRYVLTTVLQGVMGYARPSSE